MTALAGKCAVSGCQNHKKSGRAGVLCVDHSRVTKKIRGVICDNHNRGIGFLGDDAASVYAAACYLAAAEMPSLVELIGGTEVTFA